MNFRALLILPALLLFSIPAQADFLKNLGKSIDRSVDRAVDKRVNKVNRKIEDSVDVDKNLTKAEKAAVELAENADSKTGVHECGTGDNLLLEDITIKVPKKKWAVVARGACKLTLKNVRITGARGILLNGAAVVSLEKVRIQTEKRGITATGAASIKMVKSQVRVRDKKSAAVIGKGALNFTMIDSRVNAKVAAFNVDGTASMDIDEKSRVNGKKYKSE